MDILRQTGISSHGELRKEAEQEFKDLTNEAKTTSPSVGDNPTSNQLYPKRDPSQAHILTYSINSSML